MGSSTVNRNRAVYAAVLALAVVLFVLSLLGTYLALQEGGEGLASSLLGLYLTGLLLAAVLRDSMQTRGWRIAFFAGVAVWGGYEYFAGDGSLLSLLLGAVGVVMVLANALDR